MPVGTSCNTFSTFLVMSLLEWNYLRLGIFANIIGNKFVANNVTRENRRPRRAARRLC